MKERGSVITTGPLLFILFAALTSHIMKGDDGMIKNKIYATLLLGTGIVSMILSKDATLLLLVSMFAIPMFFSKKEWIY